MLLRYSTSTQPPTNPQKTIGYAFSSESRPIFALSLETISRPESQPPKPSMPSISQELYHAKIRA
ncbi:hypothetical protein L207DRAFT_506293 [Hyaloscypha variabilis F]|uniref:Uncharacterized protein n=1 Tax=Hyaloscypha variabilis (strain UAMH 11265 / GT02V1 / F) TaxID=1149755 RepID=A0A2J6S951_HYAVF|nr:hypothetical protein L207DRAFT_506293 [Hyaloscypha variabilis F]